jgi:hypothetical protein
MRRASARAPGRKTAPNGSRPRWSVVALHPRGMSALRGPVNSQTVIGQRPEVARSPPVHADGSGAARRVSAASFINPPGPIAIANASLDIDLSANGPTVAFIGSLPLGEAFDLHARGGVFFADTTTDIRVGVSGGSASDDFSANSQDLFFGLGATYSFTPSFGITVDYTLFKDVGDEDETGEADVSTLTAGAIFRF